jgi:hypothetical protein
MDPHHFVSADCDPPNWVSGHFVDAEQSRAIPSEIEAVSGDHELSKLKHLVAVNDARRAQLKEDDKRVRPSPREELHEPKAAMRKFKQAGYGVLAACRWKATARACGQRRQAAERQAASVVVRVSTLGGISTDIPVLRTGQVSELMDEYARQTGKAHFDLATCERVLDESELLSDILLETAETSKDAL